jgi:uncharacterized protein YbaA (DUF1428 family)
MIGLSIGIWRSPVLGLFLGLPRLLVGTGCFVWIVTTLTRSWSAGPSTTICAKLDARPEERTLEAWIEERKEASRQRRDVEEVLAAPKMQQAAEVTPLDYESLKREIVPYGV